MDKLKIFAIENDGETEHVAAMSDEQALKFIKDETGNDYDEAVVTEVPELEWPSHTVAYFDDDPDENGDPPTKTFAEIMAEIGEATEPFYICTTDY